MSLVPFSTRTMLRGSADVELGEVTPPFPFDPALADQWLLDNKFGGRMIEFDEGHDRYIVKDNTRRGTRRRLRTGYARRFDGAATQFNFKPLINGLNEMAIAALVYLEPAGDGQWQTFFFGGEPTEGAQNFNEFAWLNRTTLNNIQFRPGASVAGTSPDFVIPSGQWVWIGISVFGPAVAHYIDDVRVNDIMGGAGLTMGSRSQIGRVGQASNPFALNGLIAEYRIWERAITDDEWDAVRAGQHVPNPVAYYKCDEESGDLMLSSRGGSDIAHATLLAGLDWRDTIDDTVNRVRSPANELGFGTSIRWGEPLSGIHGINTNTITGNMATQPWEFEALVRHASSGGNRTLFGKRSEIWCVYNGDTGVFQLRLGGTTNGVDLTFFVGVSRVQTSALLRITYNGNGLVTMFEDGVQLGSTVLTGPSDPAATLPLWIGSLPTGSPWGGDIAWVRFSVAGETLVDYTGRWRDARHVEDLARVGVPAVTGDVFQGIVPRDEATPSQDIYGRPLLFSGPAPRDAHLLTPVCRFGENISSRATLSDTFPLTGGDLTVGVWYKRREVKGASQALAQRELTPGFGWRLWLLDFAENGTIRFDLGTAGLYTQLSFDPPSGNDDLNWHHVCAVRDGTELILYYNGVRAAAVEGPAGTTEEAPITIGNLISAGNQFLGELFGLFFADKALTPDEIRGITDGDVAPRTLPPDVIEYFPMQDGFGDRINGALAGWEAELFSLSEAFAWDAAGRTSVFNRWPYVAAAPRFNGIDQFINLRNVPPFPDITESDFSFSAWIRPNDTNTHRWVVGNSVGIGGAGWHCQVDDNNDVSFAVLTDVSNFRIVESGSLLSFNRAYHVVGVWDRAAERNRIWIDGVEDSDDFIDQGDIGNLTSVNATTIGIEPVNGIWPFNGAIWGFRLYDRQLTQDEITWLATRGDSGTEPADPVRQMDLLEDGGRLHFDSTGSIDHGEANNLAGDLPNDGLPKTRQAQLIMPRTPTFRQAVSFTDPRDFITLPNFPGTDTLSLSMEIGEVEVGAIGMVISRGLAGDFAWQVRIELDGSMRVWQFQAAGLSYRDTIYPGVFARHTWRKIHIEFEQTALQIWVDGVLNRNAQGGVGTWNFAGGQMRMGLRADGGADAGRFSLGMMAYGTAIDGADREDYSRREEGDLFYFSHLETSHVITDVRDESGNDNAGVASFADLVESKSQRAPGPLPRPSASTIIVPGQAMDHYGGNPDSPFATKINAIPRYFDVRDDQDLVDQAYQYSITPGTNDGVLRGYRSVGHPTSPEGFGGLNVLNFAGHRVWQLTATSGSGIIQLQLGEGGGEFGPGSIIQWEFPGLVAPAQMFWNAAQSRYDGTSLDIFNLLDSNQGTPLLMNLRPVGLPRIRVARLRSNGKDRVIVDTNQNDPDGLKAYAREQP